MKRIETLPEWKRPRAPSLRSMFDDVRVTPAVLTFLRDTRVGRIISLAPREDEEEGEEEDSEGEEGGQGLL